MGKRHIREDEFTGIINQYNSGGKTAAYDYLRSQYGIKEPYKVINRIKVCGKYTYDADKDRFSEIGTKTAENTFMDLDELCGASLIPAESQTAPSSETRADTIESLVHELISDRLLTFSRYIALDTSARTMLIDCTSLSADGYHIVIH